MVYEVYTTLFLVGTVGLIAQGLLGGLHFGHIAHHGGAGHAVDSGQHGIVVHHVDSAHDGHTAQSDHTSHTEHGGRAATLVLSLLSPLTLFSLCLGIGATGLLVQPLHLPATIVGFIAAIGGLGFYSLVVRPIWRLIFKFASKPSLALEGTVAHDAEVLTKFDSTGTGLVRLTVDGQFVRILATLESDDRPTAVDLVPGDKLTVTSVDGHNNTCRVARL